MKRFAEFIQLDELSKGTLGRYIKGAARDAERLGTKAGELHRAWKFSADASSHMFNRLTGIERAAAKLTNKSYKHREKAAVPRPRKQIQELLKKTLSKYVRKSAGQLAIHAFAKAAAERAQGHKPVRSPDNRRMGIERAVRRLTDTHPNIKPYEGK